MRLDAICNRNKYPKAKDLNDSNLALQLMVARDLPHLLGVEAHLGLSEYYESEDDHGPQAHFRHNRRHAKKPNTFCGGGLLGRVLLFSEAYMTGLTPKRQDGNTEVFWKPIS